MASHGKLMSALLATTTTLKAPLDETLAFVNYHLQQGIDHMFLYFDDPCDAAFHHLEKCHRVTCIRCDSAHWIALGIDPYAPVQVKQVANATDAFAKAYGEGIQWLLHIDSDELLYSNTPLKSLFSSVPSSVDVLIFPVKEAVPQKWTYECPFAEISLFKYDPRQPLNKYTLVHRRSHRQMRNLVARVWDYRIRVAKYVWCNHPDVLGSFLIGHSIGKAATKTSTHVESIGNHSPVSGPGRLQVHVLLRAAVLHFDCKGYAQWRSKWENRITDPEKWDLERWRADRRRVMEMFSVAFHSGCEERLWALYRKLYFLSARERLILRVLGLVQRINLSDALFVSPEMSWQSAEKHRGGRQ